MSHGFSLRNGAAKSCGCLTTEQIAKRAYKHGKAFTPEWWTWVRARSRCENPKTTGFERYGGRGIKVCERWQVFENFLADMGPRPSRKHSLDRINNDGNYEPGNCRWATQKEQHNNKCTNHYVVYRGKRMSLTEAIETAGSGMSPNGVRGRLSRRWGLVKALETPPDPTVYNWRRGY